MCAEDKDQKGWGRRLDGLIKRVGDEVGGERGEKVRERLTQAKSRVEAGLESEEARRVRGEMTSLGDKAMERVDDALRHERTQHVVKRVDAALTEIGDRIRGEHTESPTVAPPSKPQTTSPKPDEPVDQSQATAATSAEAAAESDEASTVRDASSGAGSASPAMNTNGEDEAPAKTA